MFSKHFCYTKGFHNNVRTSSGRPWSKAPVLANFFGITLQKTIQLTQFPCQNNYTDRLGSKVTTSTCMESQLRNAIYLRLLIWTGQRLYTSYLSAINFHDQGPSATAACAKVSHLTIHRNLPRAHLENVSFVAFRSDYKTKRAIIK